MAILRAIYLKSQASLIQATTTGEDDDACVLSSRTQAMFVEKKCAASSWMRYCW